jgi:F-type H+-transporting ATPase subunit b
MQSLDIISINIWQILISFCNLIILFFIVKKILFEPVKKMVAEREALAAGIIDEANEQKKLALEDKALWESKLSAADKEADEIIKKAVAKADRRSDVIIGNAQERADGILRQAKVDAELEQKKAQEGIRREIIDLSSVLTKKMLKREINERDHREMIDEFLQDIGDIS